jgi:hypothetical protein
VTKDSIDDATTGQEVVSSGATMAVLGAGIDGALKIKSLEPHAASAAAAVTASNKVCGRIGSHFFVSCISIDLKVIFLSISYKF